LKERSVSEAYTVVDGDQYIGAIFFGMPRNAEEEDCAPNTIARLVGGASTIVDWQLHTSGDARRTILTSITLSNGVRLHLGASPEGAIIYRKESTR
jgi:hypothetical protein